MVQIGIWCWTQVTRTVTCKHSYRFSTIWALASLEMQSANQKHWGGEFEEGKAVVATDTKVGISYSSVVRKPYQLKPHIPYVYACTRISTTCMEHVYMHHGIYPKATISYSKPN